MKVHYLEIVTTDVEAVCQAYALTHGVSFGDPDALLGQARTCLRADGSMVGVRAPLRDSELPVVRPYWLVDDIELAVTALQDAGATIAMMPMELPGKGKFAIYILGSTEQGLWQI